MMRPIIPYGTTLLASAAIALSISVPSARAYPIDCAILLCLAGGWPASAECSVAKAEFIRRITPYPVEPPLQIWRCPMGASTSDGLEPPMERLNRLKDSSAVPYPERPMEGGDDMIRVGYASGAASAKAIADFLIASQVVGGMSATDFSGPDFDVVRSIKVWHLGFYARMRTRDIECIETYGLSLGTYDALGRFNTRRATIATLPAWMNLRRICPNPGYRAVGVSWRDYFGQEGHELVRY